MKKFIVFLMVAFMTTLFVSCENNNQQVLEKNDTIEEIIDDTTEAIGDTVIVIYQDTTNE